MATEEKKKPGSKKAMHQMQRLCHGATQQLISAVETESVPAWMANLEDL